MTEQSQFQREREINKLAQRIIGHIVYGYMKGGTEGADDIAREIIQKDGLLASRSSRIAELEHEVERYKAKFGELPHDPVTDGGPLPNKPYVIGEETARVILNLERRQVTRDSLKG